MARAASSMSLNILGFTAAVWAITAAVAVSTFSSALQQGQVTSMVELFAILRMIPQKRPKRASLKRLNSNGGLKGKGSPLKFDGEDAEYVQQLPAQQED